MAGRAARRTAPGRRAALRRQPPPRLRADALTAPSDAPTSAPRARLTGRIRDGEPGPRFARRSLRMTRLTYGRQTIDDDDIAAVVEALRSPQLTCGRLVGGFEAAVAGWLGAPHATVCSSGTAALHLTYAALGIGEGDEIITTPLTFSATAAAAYYVGASVRIADVDPCTGNLTPESVEPLITPRTRAIVPV